MSNICIKNMDINRIIQDDSGKVDELINDTMEKFICIQSLDDETGQLTPSLFLLKTSESTQWNRFFLDAGICFWDIFSQLPEDDLENQEDYPWYDLSVKHNLKGEKILAINICPFKQGVKLEIILSNENVFEISTSTVEDDTYMQIK